MDLKRFKELHLQFRKKPPHFGSPEQIEFDNALHSDTTLSTWYWKQLCKEAGINHKLFCCLDMAVHMIDDKKLKTGEFDSDCVMTYSKYHKEFGIPVHDGGQSFIVIKFCPWCGTRLTPIKTRNTSKTAKG